MNPIPQDLLEQLRHPDKSERSDAVFQLDRMDNPDKLAILIQALRTEPDLFVREDITFALMHMGDLAVPALIALLQDEDAGVRHHVAHVLGKIGHPDAADALIRTLQDTAPHVAAKSAFALGQIGDAKAIPALVNLLGHENREVQTALINVLEEFGAEAVPALLVALEHERWRVREHAADALGVIGDSVAVPALIHALQDAHWQVRFAAVTALHYLGDRAARPALQQLQNDPESRVSSLVATILR